MRCVRFGLLAFGATARASVHQALKEMDEGYLRRREAIRTQVSQLSRTYQRKLAVVSGSDTAKALESLEQKLRHYEQSIFAIRECEWALMRLGACVCVCVHTRGCGVRVRWRGACVQLRV